MNPIKFLSQVKQEGSKVTWATRSETVSVTAIVLVMIAIAAVFFTFADWAIYNIIQRILGF